MKLSELSLTDLYKLEEYIKTQMEDYSMFDEHDKLVDEDYLLLESKIIKIENAIEEFEQNIDYETVS